MWACVCGAGEWASVGGGGGGAKRGEKEKTLSTRFNTVAFSPLLPLSSLSPLPTHKPCLAKVLRVWPARAPRYGSLCVGRAGGGGGAGVSAVRTPAPLGSGVMRRRFFFPGRGLPTPRALDGPPTAAHSPSALAKPLLTILGARALSPPPFKSGHPGRGQGRPLQEGRVQVGQGRPPVPRRPCPPPAEGACALFFCVPGAQAESRVRRVLWGVARAGAGGGGRARGGPQALGEGGAGRPGARTRARLIGAARSVLCPCAGRVRCRARPLLPSRAGPPIGAPSGRGCGRAEGGAGAGGAPPAVFFLGTLPSQRRPFSPHSQHTQGRVTANGRVGATAAVYTAAILGTCWWLGGRGGSVRGDRAPAAP